MKEEGSTRLGLNTANDIVTGDSSLLVGTEKSTQALYWSITMELRHVKERDPYGWNLKVQQKWVNDLGGQQWRDLEISDNDQE